MRQKTSLGARTAYSPKRKGNVGTAAFLALIAAVALSACTESPAGPAATPSATVKTSDYSASLEFTGGNAGAADPTKAPIEIGLANLEGGVPSTPETRLAAEAAVKLVNEKLGGIKGHPLTLTTCIVTNSEEQGLGCGQQMANSRSIKAVVEGPLVVGADSFHTAIDGKLPVVEVNPGAQGDLVSENSFSLFAGVPGSAQSLVKYVSQDLAAKKVALLYSGDDANATAAAKVLTEGMTGAGVKVTQATFSATTADFTGPLTAAGAASADVVVPFVVSPPTCIAAAKAIKQLAITKPVVAYSFCVDANVKKALTDDAPWTYMFQTPNPQAPTDDQQVGDYLAAMGQYAPDAQDGAFAVQGFSAVMTLSKIFNKLGPDALTTASVSQELGAFKGPGFLSPPKYQFGFVPQFPAMGTSGVRFYSYESGTWSDEANGRWVAP